MLLINQYSFLLVSLVIVGIAMLLSSRSMEFRYTAVLLVLITSSLVVFQLQFKTGANEEFSVDLFNEALSTEEPLVVIVYSDMCVACLSAKPAIDDLEQELNKLSKVIRVNVTSDLGRYLRSEHESGLVPSFLVFDNRGKEIWRYNGGVPDLDIIKSLDF